MAACSTNVSAAIRIFVRWQGKRVCRGGNMRQPLCESSSITDGDRIALLWYLTVTADEV
nr:hypothetical protein RVX_0679 [Nitratidesulfovibrio sp. HK-II]